MRNMLYFATFDVHSHLEMFVDSQTNLVMQIIADSHKKRWSSITGN